LKELKSETANYEMQKESLQLKVSQLLSNEKTIQTKNKKGDKDSK